MATQQIALEESVQILDSGHTSAVFAEHPLQLLTNPVRSIPASAVGVPLRGMQHAHGPVAVAKHK